MAGNVRRKKFLEEQDVLALVEATAGERFALRDRALLGLIYAGGLRVGEVARLHVEELLIDDGGVVVVGKRWRPRFVPVAAPVLDWLREYLVGIQAGPIFTAAHGGPMSARLMRKVLDKYAGRVRLPKISPHTLRHSCASHMLARGMYLPELSRFLGHKKLSTTTVYLHEVPRGVDLGAQYRAAHPLAARR